MVSVLLHMLLVDRADLRTDKDISVGVRDRVRICLGFRLGLGLGLWYRVTVRMRVTARQVRTIHILYLSLSHFCFFCV